MNSREKGKRGEREFASVMREYGFPGARRSEQYCGKGEEAQDVVDCLPGIHKEVKRREALNVYEALAQAERDAKEQNLPTVFWRRNSKKWVVIMELEDWMNLYREYYSGKVIG